MARLLGDRLVPESIQSRRRSFRSRVESLRDPIRSRRRSLVPGPDLIGMAEQQVSDLRDSFVSRDSVIASLRDIVDGGMGGDGGSGDGNGESSGNDGSGSSGNGSSGSSGSRGRSGDEVRA